MNLEKIDFISLDATIYYEKITVKGKAKVSLKSRSCEFSSDFVPLLPLNSEVLIETAYNGVNVFKIKGQTFVSTKRFMRIQPITVSLYNGAEEVIDVTSNIPVSCIRKHFFTTIQEKCRIVSCSSKRIMISGINLLPERSDVTIDILVENPISDNPASISLTFADSGMLFGINSKKAKYLYNISRIDDETYDALLKYIRIEALNEIKRQWSGHSLEVYNINIFK